MDQDVNIDEIEDRFFVRGRMEVLNVLNDLVYRCEPVTVIFGGAERHPTRLLEARGNVLVFESGIDRGANARLLQGNRCTFIASPDGIRVQFAAGQAKRISWGGCRAFCVPLPDCVARVQRQESYRILVTPEQALTARLFSDEGSPLGEWPVRDLSVGGLGIAIQEASSLALCKNAAHVRFSLPQHGSIDCAVTLRHATGANADDGYPPYRIGLMFSALPPEMGVAIQRYIIEQEQQRRSRIADYDADDHD